MVIWFTKVKKMITYLFTLRKPRDDIFQSAKLNFISFTEMSNYLNFLKKSKTSSLIPKVDYFNIITLFYRETFDCDRTIISKRKKIFNTKRMRRM